MGVEDVLRVRGGLASRAELLQTCSRADVDRALRTGAITATGRGRYALCDIDTSASLAHQTGGVLCLSSAALHHGWEVSPVPVRPHVVFPRKRKLSVQTRALVDVHRGDLHESEIDGIATTKEKTLEMCSRSLPAAQALSVGDSALRRGDVLPRSLRAMAMAAHGPGSAQMRWVAQHADARAANPFESALRAIALTVPGLNVEPQKVIRGTRVWARPDMTDVDLGVVIEADSYEWQGTREGFDKDVKRYTLLTAEGWLVLRFTWPQVYLQPDWVRAVLMAVVALVEARTYRGQPSRPAA